MRVLFCGGGTGGHITPALAMADMLKQNCKSADFAFVGRCGGRENSAITKEGYKLYELDVSGISRSLSPKNLASVYKALAATKKAKEIIKEFRPDIVIGTGGYVSFPVLRAGVKSRIPTVLHESNSYPGLVTRLMGKRCDKVLLCSERALKHLKHKHNAAVTGNPVRSAFKCITKSEARRKLGIPDGDFFILSFGGSLGAEKINYAVTEYMKKYTGARGLTYIHATGLSGFEKYRELSERFSRESPKFRILPYIEQMPVYLSGCDIVISRSGAMTLAEICQVGIPPILIPSPYVTDNHQFENAKALADEGCAIILEEEKLTPQSLESAINQLRFDRSIRKSIEGNLKNKKKANAERKIYDEITKVLSRYQKR